jgi:hypothetical protein
VVCWGTREEGYSLTHKGETRIHSGGGGRTPRVPPAEIPQQWEGDLGDVPANPPTGPGATAAFIAPPQQPQTATTKGTYSRMATAIKKWGIRDTNAQMRELLWQRGVGGKKPKISQFQEVAGALQEFKTYLFIKLGSAFCTVVHLPMKFMAVSEATQHLQGRFIGFIGDPPPCGNPPQSFSHHRRCGNGARQQWLLMGPPFLVTTRRTLLGVVPCGPRQPIAKKRRQFYRAFFISPWCYLS